MKIAPAPLASYGCKVLPLFQRSTQNYFSRLTAEIVDSTQTSYTWKATNGWPKAFRACLSIEPPPRVMQCDCATSRFFVLLLSFRLFANTADAKCMLFLRQFIVLFIVVCSNVNQISKSRTRVIAMNGLKKAYKGWRLCLTRF